MPDIYRKNRRFEVRYGWKVRSVDEMRAFLKSREHVDGRFGFCVNLNLYQEAKAIADEFNELVEERSKRRV